MQSGSAGRKWRGTWPLPDALCPGRHIVTPAHCPLPMCCSSLTPALHPLHACLPGLWNWSTWQPWEVTFLRLSKRLRVTAGPTQPDPDNSPNPACKHRAGPAPSPAWPHLSFQWDAQTSQAAARPRTATLHKEDISQFTSILIYERTARRPGHQRKERKAHPNS